MKTPLLLATLLAASVRAADAPAEPVPPIVSKITDVVVFADRAQVTRAGAVQVPAGTTRVAFARLPGWIDEGSVRVALAPADAGRILDVQVERSYLTRPSDEEFQKAEAAVREISDQIAALDDEKAVLDAQSKQVDSIRLFALDKLPKDAAIREVKPAEYAETVKFVTGSLREIAAAKRDLDKKRRELQPELTARQRKLEDLRQRSQLEQRSVVVTLQGSAPKTATLSLVYMIPGATWEPMHELRANSDSGKVHLASYAVVIQTSGEDWTGVNLALSTQRSTDTMKIPELEKMLLGSGRRLTQVITGTGDSFAAANKNFEAQNTLFFDLNNGSVDFQREYRRNRALQTDNMKRIEVVFEKLQQRGTTAHFPALGAQTVRTDGRAVRVPIGATELAALPRIIAAPEISLNAARTVDLTNTTKQSVLPGKVALFAEGAFLGLTETDFVAPGESFSMYLGVAEQVKLTRTLDKKHSELKRSGQRTKMQVAYIVSVENLSDKPATLQLTDRIPVSETDEIKVTTVKAVPDAKPDHKGILKWDVVVAAKATREFRLEYVLDYPNDLTSRKPEPAAQSASPTPAIDLQYQIRELEKKF